MEVEWGFGTPKFGKNEQRCANNVLIIWFFNYFDYLT